MAPAYASPKRAAKAAALGFAPAGAIENSKGRARQNWSRRGPNLSIKVGQIRLTNASAFEAVLTRAQKHFERDMVSASTLEPK